VTIIYTTKFLYKYFLKPILFIFDPETVHNLVINLGQQLGKSKFSKKLLNRTYNSNHPTLSQELFGITFKNPVGLAAGFDYNGELTQILGSVGFGFQSIGTVTFSDYEGNKAPRLVRLPKSKSILVNKGFKNDGIKKVLNKNIQNWEEAYQVGISIGATNSPDCTTPQSQIEDIVNSFRFLKIHRLYNKLAYLELNISCPNVLGSGSLADPNHLKQVLEGIKKLEIRKPLLVKLQLEIPWKKARELIQIMIDYKVDGVIIANLLKRRNATLFEPKELDTVRFLKGNFSGAPTKDFSNELIEKAYKEFGHKIKIIGLGGIFNAQDAYEKIKRGASLVQLITGMIYEGPQLIAEINMGLEKRLKEDGYKNIKEAVGVKSIRS